MSLQEFVMSQLTESSQIQPIPLNSVYPCYLSNHIFLLMWFIAISCSFTKHNCLQYFIKLASLFVTVSMQTRVTRAPHMHCQNSQQKREWESSLMFYTWKWGVTNTVCNGVKQTKLIQHSSIAKHIWRAAEKQRQLSRRITVMEAITSMAKVLLLHSHSRNFVLTLD